MSDDGATLFVADGAGDRVFVLDAEPLRVRAEVKVGLRPWNLALAPGGRKLYVANGRSDDVSIVDLASLRVVRALPVDAGPWGIVILP